MKALPPLSSIIVSAVMICSHGLGSDCPTINHFERKQSLKDLPWNVRVEVLMVAMPQEKALALLPELRDPEKIESAVAQIVSAVGRKEATLMGYPVAFALDGERGVSETILEKRYPTQYEPPSHSDKPVPATPLPAGTAAIDYPIPTTFETRNTGVTLDIEPRVSPTGEWIRLNALPQRVELLGFDAYDATKTTSGKVVKIDQPQFFLTKTTSSLKLRNGQRCLLAVLKLPRPEFQSITYPIEQPR